MFKFAVSFNREPHKPWNLSPKILLGTNRVSEAFILQNTMLWHGFQIGKVPLFRKIYLRQEALGM